MAKNNRVRMPRPVAVAKAIRSLVWLGIITLVLVGINAIGVFTGAGSWTPKLALDLEGGTQVILAPVVSEGQTITQEQLNQAVSIIRQRIDATGVSEAEINTQGNNIVVTVPGTMDDQTRQRIEASAQLELRPVLLTSAATPITTATATPGSTDAPGADVAATPTPSASSTPAVTPTDGSDPNWVTPELQANYDSFDCAVLEARTEVAPADQPVITCDLSSSQKFLLGPVEVSGSDISDANASLVTTQSGGSTGEWAVNLVFNAEGTKQFAAVSTRLYGLESPRNQFAFVLDGAVLSAPSMNAVITDGKPQITGSFTQESAKALADQLKYGALPLSFTVQSSDTISATLGTSQLTAGLLAGLIGLILVVIYTLFQYRLLGLVTIASLVVAAVLTYVIITILSWRQGYRLSLAGVAGLIVAIGFTADSFIVYFERVRDELREGRSLPAAVDSGWKRAYRTVLASKATNLLAAIVLFILAVGSVRGFAYTLGLTTIIDVLVVFLFTHPMLALLSHNNFFASGHPMTGLDPNALGAVYRGRAQFRPAAGVGEKKLSKAAREAQKRQTIAERKAAAHQAEVLEGKDEHNG